MAFLFLNELGSEPFGFIGGISTDIAPPANIDPTSPRYLDTAFDNRYLITEYEDRTSITEYEDRISINEPNCSG